MSNEKIIESTEAAATAESTESTEKKSSKGKKIFIAVFAITLLIGVIIGGCFFWQSTSYLTTGNASIRTNLIPIHAGAPGRLDRFDVSVGDYVLENEIIGRVETAGFLRSPVDGVVVRTNAVLNQSVTPMEPIAVIADVNNIHIRANIEETQLSQLRIGQRAYVTLDVRGNQQFAGYISEIGLVTDAALLGQMTSFTTAGTFTRVTQLIPIEIRITDNVRLYDIIGTNATVRIPLR